MKIYEIGTGYTPIPAKVAAATESVVEELTKAFLEARQDVEIIDIACDDRIVSALPITEVKIPSLFTKSDISLGIVHKLKRVVYSCALALKLKKILKNANERVVLHFHNQYNLFFFLKLTSKKTRSNALITYTNHNGVWCLPWEEAEPILKKRYFQEIVCVKNADINFVLNEATKESIVSHFGVREESVAEVANGVNSNVYYPLADKEQAKEKYGLTGKRVILQVGSVNENKGQCRTLALIAPFLKQNENTVFAYAGGIVSQEYFDEVAALAQELGVSEQVVYLGMVSPGDEMNELYNIADVTVCASKYESFALVAIESLSAGVPVIICSNGLRDFGKGCIMCNDGDFINTLTALFEDKEAYTALCSQARETAVGKYSWRKIAQDYLLSMR